MSWEATGVIGTQDCDLRSPQEDGAEKETGAKRLRNMHGLVSLSLFGILHARQDR
jgi:hypothetical protein